MAAPACRAPAARRATFPFDSRGTFLFGSRAALPLLPPRRLPPPTAAPTSPAPIPLSLAVMDLGAESSPTLAPSTSGSSPPQGHPRGAGLPSVADAATSVEHQASSLALQAAIGRNQAKLKMPASRSSMPTAPPLHYPPAATVVSNAGGDAFRADARTVSIKVDCIDEGENKCVENKHKGNTEIASEDDEQQGENELKDAEIIKIMIDEAVQKAFTGAWVNPTRSSELKGFINDSVKKAINDSLLSSQPSNSYMSRVDHMKLVREALSEHQTFSRVLYVLALGTPVTLLITRAVRGQSLGTDKNMIRNTGLEMGFSFLIVYLCHLYIIFFHFVRMEGPKVSMRLMRLIILFLCLLVSAWMLIYTFYMPQNLFPTKFWSITGVFLGLNWVSSGILGCTGMLRESWMVDV